MLSRLAVCQLSAPWSVPLAAMRAGPASKVSRLAKIQAALCLNLLIRVILRPSFAGLGLVF
ncbi:hypothetical protein GCM10009113_10120 [Marinobacter szutsaonensis]